MNLPIPARVRKLLKAQTIFSLMLAACAGILLPALAHGQIALGTGTSKSLGTVTLGSNTTSTLSFNVAANTVLAKTAVVTGGATGKDFTNVGDGSCTPQTFSSSGTCTVDVKFQPIAAGPRNGAVVFYDNANKVIGMAPVYGIGDGAQIAYGPGTTSTVPLVIGTTALPAGNAVAVDGAGDLFVAYLNLPRVLEIPADGSSPSPIALSSVRNPKAARFVAVDGAGNLFVVMDTGDVLEVPPPYTTSAPVLLSQLSNGDNKGGLAVDGQGNLFVADNVSAQADELPLPYPTSTPMSFTPKIGGKTVLNMPNGMAVDGKGDLFFGNGGNGGVGGNNNVLEVPPPYATSTPVVITPTVDGVQLSGPSGVAVDAAGDLFIADTNNHRVVEVPAGGGQVVAISPTEIDGIPLQVSYTGLAVDAFGNVIGADPSTGQLYELERQSAMVNFPTPTKAGTTDTTDGPQTVQVINIGTQAPVGEGVLASYPADFSAAAPDSTCTETVTLSAGSWCVLAIQFTPAGGTSAGLHSESVDFFVGSSGPGGAVTVTGTVTSATTGSNKTTITLTAQANPGALGTQDSITAALSTASGVAAPTGKVTFSVLGIPLGAVTVSAGKATFANLLLQAGAYQLTATYSGDANYSTATATFNGKVNQAAPVLTLTPPPSPMVGQQAKLTATVNSPLTANGVAPPSGTVIFSFDGIPVGNPVKLVGGVATIADTPPISGEFPIKAVYSGDTNFVTESKSLTVNVAGMPQTITFTPPTVTYGVGSVDLSKYAKSSSGLPVSFTLDGGTAGTLSGSILKVTSRGWVGITASQVGNSTYAKALGVYGNVIVNSAVLNVYLEDAGTTYGASIPSPQGFTITGLVNGDMPSVITGAAQAWVTLPGKFPYPAGSYPDAILGSQGTLVAPNYTFKIVPANLTIYKAQLVVTANNLFMSKGSPVPPLTYTIGGFLVGDTLATAVTGAPALSTTATTASAAGSYTITAANKSLAAANYSFTLVNGILTVQ
jgi:hypothetical protein